MTVNDRLYDELLQSIAEKFYETAKALADASGAPSGPRVALLARLNALQECGARTAEVLGVPEPLWDGMRGVAGMSW